MNSRRADAQADEASADIDESLAQGRYRQAAGREQARREKLGP